MRKLLLSSALMLTFLQVIAGEDDQQASVTGSPSVGGLFPHFGLAIGPNTGQQGIQRMIGKTKMVYGSGAFTQVDSNIYQYSNGRGSVPNPDEINNDDHVLFDASTTYTFAPSVMAYEYSRQRTQRFNSDNKVSELVYKRWHHLTSGWMNTERYVYTYDNTSKMHSSLFEQWYGGQWTRGINSVLSYDNNNNVVQMNSVTYTIDFVYDQSNKLVMIEDKTRDQSTGWTNNERKKYTYTGDEVSEYILEKWDNNTWTNISRSTYSYDANDNLVLSTDYTWNGTGWQQIRQEVFTYDSNGNMLQNIEKVWDAASSSFINAKKEERIYNSYNLPTKITTYTWLSQGWAHADGDITVRYYYEVYFPTSTPNITAIDQMQVYPVPASDVLNVAARPQAPGEFTVTLMDMAGRVVYTVNSGYTADIKQAVPVQSLPAGHYALKISGNGLNLSRTVAVAH